MALYLERLVRVRLDGIDEYAASRVLIPLVSGSFEDVPLAEACRLCREDAVRSPERRSWVLRIKDDP